MRIFRWFLIVPSAIIGWYLGIIVAIFIYSLNDWLCPAEYIVSGMCGAPWSSFVQDFAIAFGSVIAAALVVFLPTIIAPDHRRVVAITAYVTGLLFACYWLFYGQWVPVVWAGLSGGITLWFTHRVLTLRSRGTPQKRVALNFTLGIHETYIRFNYCYEFVLAILSSWRND